MIYRRLPWRMCCDHRQWRPYVKMHIWIFARARLWQQTCTSLSADWEVNLFSKRWNLKWVWVPATIFFFPVMKQILMARGHKHAAEKPPQVYPQVHSAEVIPIKYRKLCNQQSKQPLITGCLLLWEVNTIRWCISKLKAPQLVLLDFKIFPLQVFTDCYHSCVDIIWLLPKREDEG